MTLGNYKAFRASHIDAIQFGSTAWTEANMIAVDTALDTSFATNNATPLLDLTGFADALSPTKSYAFAKDFSTSGNERTSDKEDLLGADSQGSQNSEQYSGANSLTVTEFTCVYRNPMPTSIFNDTTKACFISMDNSESSATGVVNLAFNNIIMLQVGALTRNSDGLMEQKVKFSCRGGLAGTAIAVTQATPAETWQRYRVGPDYAEEIRLT